MLRVLYICCDILSACLALLSPVAIMHWLLACIGIAVLAPYLAPLDGFFAPFNSAIDSMTHIPPIVYSGKSVPTAQGLFGCLLALGFFGMNFLSEYLKATEQRLDVNHQAEIQRQRLKMLKQEQNKKHQSVTVNRRFLAHLAYDSATCPTGASHINTATQRNAGKVVEHSPEAMTIEYATLEQALQFGIDASQAVSAYYATLRPMEPQPPFRIGVHAVDADLPVRQASQEAAKLIGFAGPNSVIFSVSIKEAMEAQGRSQQYRWQSLGMYSLGAQGQQELFKLFNKNA